MKGIKGLGLFQNIYLFFVTKPLDNVHEKQVIVTPLCVNTERSRGIKALQR